MTVFPIGGTRKLAVINVYGPVSPHQDKEANTEWWSGLIDLVNEWTSKGTKVTLMGDFNCCQHQMIDKGNATPTGERGGDRH